MNEYEVMLMVRVQCDSLADVPAAFTEAIHDYDNWPLTVTNLENEDTQFITVDWANGKLAND